jgi:hypothetical protein
VSVFRYHPRRRSLLHQLTGWVWPASAMTEVSLTWRLLLSMMGLIGSGLKPAVDTNLTGSPISLRFQRYVKLTELSPGSVSPRRVLSAFKSESSFLNWPFDSRCEPAPE